MRAYWQTVLTRAFARFRERFFAWRLRIIVFAAQTLIFFGLLYFIPWFGELQEEARLMGAGVLAVTISATLTFAFDFIQAPYEIDGEKSGKIEALEATVERERAGSARRIRFDGFSQEEVTDGNTGRITAFCTYVRICNVGNSQLERCLVKISVVDDKEIHAALATRGRQMAGQDGPFYLSAGDKKQFPFIYRDVSNPRAPGPHQIAFETGCFAIHRGQTILMVLAAVAEIGQPDRIKLRLSVDNNHKLKYELEPFTESVTPELQAVRDA